MKKDTRYKIQDARSFGIFDLVISCVVF